MSKSKLDYYLEKRAQIRAEHEATYAERREKAFASNRFLWFLACPTCGLNRPLKRHKREDTSFQVTADFPILQKRYGGGPGVGWFLAPDESLTLQQLKASEDSDHEVIFSNIRESIRQLAGLVDVEAAAPPVDRELRHRVQALIARCLTGDLRAKAFKGRRFALEFLQPLLEE